MKNETQKSTVQRALELQYRNKIQRQQREAVTEKTFHILRAQYSVADCITMITESKRYDMIKPNSNHIILASDIAKKFG